MRASGGPEVAQYTKDDIKRLRVEADLTQAQLAEKLGVWQTQVSAWETGKTAIGEEHQRLLSMLFGRSEGSVSNPFGDWLKREREKRNWTVQELASKAEVSAPAIYNIEAGRISNPRQGTKDRIARALSVEIPSDVTELVDSESEIKGLGIFTDFDPHAKDDLPATSGIYVLYDVSERPVYVGQGKDIASRIKDHHEKFWFKHPIVDTASYIEVKNAALREQIESLLMKFLKSNAVLNKQKVERN